MTRARALNVSKACAYHYLSSHGHMSMSRVVAVAGMACSGVAWTKSLRRSFVVTIMFYRWQICWSCNKLSDRLVFPRTTLLFLPLRSQFLFQPPFVLFPAISFNTQYSPAAVGCCSVCFLSTVLCCFHGQHDTDKQHGNLLYLPAKAKSISGIKEKVLRSQRQLRQREERRRYVRNLFCFLSTP